LRDFGLFDIAVIPPKHAKWYSYLVS
jgi:hypothetical protein